MSVFAKRLKEIRLEAGLTQDQLGVLAGMEEATSSSRMNHYEKGRHQPDYSLVERLATALEVPEGYFYTKDDDEALLLKLFHRLSSHSKNDILQKIKQK